MRWIAPILALCAATQVAAGPLPEAGAEFRPVDMAQVPVGRLLFYDPILSGNKAVACATCHHPRFGTSDGLSLGLGDGGKGLGTERTTDAANMPEQRIPRNAPGLFNLGAVQFRHMFHDGRLEEDPTRASGIRTPLEDEMVRGFSSVLSAQAMFPVLSGDEMAGHYSENDVSRAVRLGFLTGEDGAWSIISRRVEAVPEYRAAFDTILGPGAPIHFTDISNAVAAFIEFEWRADNSPFDQYLRGGDTLSEDQRAGMELFYGKAGCSTCHSGLFQTDHDFHAIAMPQIGPGKAARFEAHHRDTGRMRVTGKVEDAYRFRTPSLRNVTLTAPYGHDGAYRGLEDAVRHHLNPVQSLRDYSIDLALLPDLAGADDVSQISSPEEVAAIAAANELAPVSLTDTEVAQILAFLDSLTDRAGAKGQLGVPATVPSGLPVDQ